MGRSPGLDSNSNMRNDRKVCGCVVRKSKLFTIAITFTLLTTILLGCAGPSTTPEPTPTPPPEGSMPGAPPPSPPTPTPMPAATPVPTQPTPTPTPAPAPVPAPVKPAAAPAPTPTQQSGGPVLTLKIIEIATNLPDYDRDDWKHWADDDGDCQNTRHEVLIEESSQEVTFKSDRQCQVASGEWLDPYTGDTVTDATKLDVDHMVPLKNTHDSGGWGWDKQKKAAYANEMDYAGHLIAVTASANRKKGAKGPEEWKPANQEYWCDYAIDWVQIKIDWELSVTKAEWAALQEMLKTCDNLT